MTSPRHPSRISSIAAVPIIALAMTLGADVALFVTAQPFWAEAAEWLLLGVVIFGTIAMLVGGVEISPPHGVVRGLRRGLGTILMLAVSGANYLLRIGGTAEFAASYGLFLTAAAVGFVMFDRWMENERAFRDGIGVPPAVGHPDTE